MELQTVEKIIDIATKALLPEKSPYRHVPVPSNLGTSTLLNVPAIWTRDMLKPRWNNLAVFVGAISQENEITRWESVSNDLNIPLIVLADRNDDSCILISRTSAKEQRETTIDVDQLFEELAQYRQRLFSRSVLSGIRGGQLSFADIDDALADDSLIFYSKQRTHLESSLNAALQGAIAAQIDSYSTKSAKANDTPDDIIRPVVEVAIAYLGARILDDKGFFDGKPLGIDDPSELLRKTIERRNGFFKKAYADLPTVNDHALQHLAAHIGNSVTFALVDHADVGRLYEQAIVSVQEHLSTLKSPFAQNSLPNLQQHYTPVAIANLMLNHLPLERLRPEERIIYDPAAGSGSLLLAATQRLALMPDIMDDDLQNGILSKQVEGNDLDPTAALITKLRYMLVQETVAPAPLFPYPDIFTTKDYQDEAAWNMPLPPRVIVANPPFKHEQGKHSAVQFVNMVFEHLSNDSQFAFVLPDAFLTGEKYGWTALRQTVSQKCQLFESWRLPEGVVGLSAQQPVCIVMGVIGEPTKQYSFMARAVVTRAGNKNISEQGFLGNSWIASMDASKDDWSGSMAPPITIQNKTINLGALFDSCVGVTPKKGAKAIPTPVADVPTKLYWQQRWKKRNSLWADPNRVPQEQKYIRYSDEFLAGRNAKREEVYDSPKILMSHGSNNATTNPLSASLDTIGLCPDKNTICLVPFSKVENLPKQDEWPALGEWLSLSENDRLLWLLGILSSDMAKKLIPPGRASRHLSLQKLGQFRLPARVDTKIIELTKEILALDMRSDEPFLPNTENQRANLLNRLNKRVALSFGNVTETELQRTGVPIDIEEWQQEKAIPSYVTMGQVLKYDIKQQCVQLSLEGVPDDNGDEDAVPFWMPLPPELPGWALDGTVFTADISRDISISRDLEVRRWALRNFEHTPNPYLTIDELERDFSSFLERK